MEEEEQLPLARMISINKPSFWIFFGVCLALYITEWVLTRDTVRTNAFSVSQVVLLLAMFIGLILNIIAASIKNESLVRNFMICTYFFEIASVIAAAFLVFLP